MPDSKKLEGTIVPLITPLDDKEQLDAESLKILLDSLLTAGVETIFLGGSAGMGPMLRRETWTDLMQTAFDHLDGKCRLLAGVIETSTTRAVEKIKELAAIGYKAIAVTPVFYITLRRPEEFMYHFKACRDASDMQMIIYNIPACTGSEIPLECIEKLGAAGQLAGLKESSGNRSYFAECLKLAESYGFKIFQGNEVDISWGLSLGANGIVPVCANFDPETYVHAWKYRNNPQELIDLQKKIDFNKAKYLVRDNSANWIYNIMAETAKRLDLNVSAAVPLNPEKWTDKL